MTPLARWLHDRRINCQWRYISEFDIGLGREYTEYHESAHERDAAELLAILTETLTGTAQQGEVGGTGR